MATFEERARKIWADDPESVFIRDLARAVDELKAHEHTILNSTHRTDPPITGALADAVDLRAERDALQKRLDVLYGAAEPMALSNSTCSVFLRRRDELRHVIEAERKHREEA